MLHIRRLTQKKKEEGTFIMIYVAGCTVRSHAFLCAYAFCACVMYAICVQQYEPSPANFFKKILNYQYINFTGFN